MSNSGKSGAVSNLKYHSKKIGQILFFDTAMSFEKYAKTFRDTDGTYFIPYSRFRALQKKSRFIAAASVVMVAAVILSISIYFPYHGYQGSRAEGDSPVVFSCEDFDDCFMVNSTDGDIDEGGCQELGEGTDCTLPEALAAAQADPNNSLIQFTGLEPGPSYWTIIPDSDITISTSVIIDGDVDDDGDPDIIIDSGWTFGGCNDGLDDDGDGFVDLLDSDCEDAADTTEAVSYPHTIDFSLDSSDNVTVAGMVFANFYSNVMGTPNSLNFYGNYFGTDISGTTQLNYGGYQSQDFTFHQGADNVTLGSACFDSPIPSIEDPTISCTESINSYQANIFGHGLNNAWGGKDNWTVRGNYFGAQLSGDPLTGLSSNIVVNIQAGDPGHEANSDIDELQFRDNILFANIVLGDQEGSQVNSDVKNIIVDGNTFGSVANGSNNLLGCRDGSNGIIYRNNTVSTAHTNTNAINAGSGCHFTAISDNTITINPDSSAYSAIVLWDGTAADAISGNTITMNGGAAIQLTNTTDPMTISGNTIVGATYGAVQLSGSSNVTIDSNNIDGDQADTTIGVYLSNSTANTISNNTIYDNANYGIQLSSSASNNTVTGNSIYSNTQQGILLVASDNNSLSSNTVTTSGSSGIYLLGSASNSISSNSLSNNTGSGIYLIQYVVDDETTIYSNSNTISTNTITSNSQYGLYLSSADANIFSSNTLSDNGAGTPVAVWTAAVSPLKYGSTPYNEDLAGSCGSDPAIMYYDSGSDEWMYICDTVGLTVNDAAEAQAETAGGIDAILMYIDVGAGSKLVTAFTDKGAFGNLEGIDSLLVGYGMGSAEAYIHNILTKSGGVWTYNGIVNGVNGVTVEHDGSGVSLVSTTPSLTQTTSYAYADIYLSSSDSNSFTSETLGSSDNGIKLGGTSTGNTFTTCTISDSLGSDITSTSSGTNTFTNTTYSTHSVTTGIADFIYDFTVTIANTSGSPVPNATVSVTDKDGTASTATTNSSGVATYSSFNPYQLTSTNTSNSKIFTVPASSNYAATTSSVAINTGNQTITISGLSPARARSSSAGSDPSPTEAGGNPEITTEEPAAITNTEAPNQEPPADVETLKTPEGELQEPSSKEPENNFKPIKDEVTGMTVELDGLVKYDGYPTIYRIEADNQRHPFLDASSFFSWYPDFSQVQLISENTLLSYPLGHPVYYQPGSVLKLPDSPKVYQVSEPNILRWIPTEELFRKLGYSFNQIHDLPEAFISHYTIGDPLEDQTKVLGLSTERRSNNMVWWVAGAVIMSLLLFLLVYINYKEAS